MIDRLERDDADTDTLKEQTVQAATLHNADSDTDQHELD